MPTPTYLSLATLTLSSASSTVTFSSIPATFRDLIVVVDGTANTNSGLYFRLNSDTGTNYTTVAMGGDGSNAFSFAQTLTFTNVNFMSANKGVNITQIMDYTATDKHKTLLGRGGAAGNQSQAGAARWANTSAVNSLNLFLDPGKTFASGSTFSLYGIA